MLDRYYISVFNYYKKRLGKRSLNIALFYINLLELSITLALAAFFMAFANQMKFLTVSTSKFWTIYILIALVVIFKNWMRYNGKRRHVLNAKLKGKVNSIYLLWCLPIGSLIIALALLQVQ
ncbi:hypothetical protein [Winogradskyella tangerina]|uniref:hypothetical protein n=1 Tax=Winogradskyella tangerina TaxID=2023240 RepID=UPI000DBE5BA7|nr:hypothetical protein [Winogradskyella tangerina]